jgi:hypothetical protein
VRKLAFMLGIWLITMAMADKRAHPSRKANNTKNRVSADYAAHWTTINAHTTAINAVNTGSGGTTQENFLGSLNQQTNFGQSASGGWTAGGVLGPGTWDSSHATALVGWMNAVAGDLGDILTALRNANMLH